jgi:hypothetical protein
MSGGRCQRQLKEIDVEVRTQIRGPELAPVSKILQLVS